MAKRPKPDGWEPLPRCQARSKSHAGQCGNRVLTGFEVCGFHGAKGGRPITHGRYSKYLPSRLQGRYEEMLRDPEITSVRDNIAMLDWMIVDRVQGMTDSRPAEAWQAASSSLERLSRECEDVWANAGLKDEDIAEARDSIAAIRTILDGGLGDAKREQDIRQLMQEQRRQAETEAKREFQLQTTLTLKEANALLALLVDTITRNVPDRDAVARIIADVRSVVAGQAG